MQLVVIFGPPAVGKMTVGRALCERTGYKLFHNHASIEPVLDIFAFGTPPFWRLVEEFRRRIIEEARDADLPGLVFTFVWSVQDPADRAAIQKYVDLVGGQVVFLELAADQATRLARNRTLERLLHKPSKRDIEFSDSNLLKLDDNHVLNTGGEPTDAELLLAEHPWLRLDNTDLTADEAAVKAIAELNLSP